MRFLPRLAALLLAIAPVAALAQSASPLVPIVGRVVTPIDFGAAGDGVTNDTTAVQNAIDYLESFGAGGTLYLGNHQYCVNQINITSPIRIVGAGTNGQGVPTTGFRACSVNLAPMINITGVGVTLENFGINMATPATAYSTSGAALYVQGYHDVVSHVEITDPCVGIIDTGNTDEFRYDQITGFNSNVNVSACGGIQLGNSTTQSVDALIFHTIIPMPSANSAGSSAYYYGISLFNSGGAFLADNDILYEQIGTLVAPPSGLQVQWTMLSNTVLGDSTYGNPLTINPGSGGTVKGFFCDGCWAGSAGDWKGAGTWYPATGVWVQNTTGAGAVTGVRFDSLKQNGSYGDGIDIGANTQGVQIVNSHFCGDGQNAANTYTAVSLSGVDELVTGNYMASSCFGTGGNAMRIGILMNAGGATLVQGNWVGNDDNGNKNIQYGIYISSGYGPFCEGNNFVNASVANFTNASSSTNTCN